jgi:hypothetical protein
VSRALGERTFRANPQYELVLLDRLSRAEREAVDASDDLYGVLRPRASLELSARSASSDVALLFLTLQQVGPLPSYVKERLGDELDQSIGRLVLDGVLELERDGRWISGAEAGDLVVPHRAAGGRGQIGAQSVAALRYAQQLIALPPALLALRLYLFGRRPISPRLRGQLPDESAVADHLGLSPGGAARAAVDEGWQGVPPPGGRVYWRTWRRRDGRGHLPDSYKLYVSPAIDALPDALVAVAESLAGARGVSAFKVGTDLPGICRPDKLVVYVDRLDDLQQAAQRLRERLDGAPAHGVPFTAPVTADGLLSWGADPPPPTSEPATSWRMWVSERLAEYLVAARGAQSGGLEPWQFALDRLRLSGVDTDTWAPANGMWPTALASA